MTCFGILLVMNKTQIKNLHLPLLSFVILHCGSEVAALHLILQNLQEKLMIAALKVLQPGLHVLIIKALKVHLCEASSLQISRIHIILGGKRILCTGGVVDPHIL